ncbi:MAG: hypothetical protein ABGW75_05490, partial [Pirellulales bacterium]
KPASHDFMIICDYNSDTTGSHQFFSFLLTNLFKNIKFRAFCSIEKGFVGRGGGLATDMFFSAKSTDTKV